MSATYLVRTDAGYVTRRRVDGDWSSTPNADLAYVFATADDAWAVATLPGMAGRVVGSVDRIA